MDAILHVLGACGDSHSHIDVIDIILLGGTTISSVAFYIKHRFNTIVNFWKRILK